MLITSNSVLANVCVKEVSFSLSIRIEIKLERSNNPAFTFLELLKDLFEVLYDNDVISEETFYLWEKSKDFPDGKGVALSLVKGFLNWLRKAEEESNEEDSSLSTINTSTKAA